MSKCRKGNSRSRKDLIKGKNTTLGAVRYAGATLAVRVADSLGCALLARLAGGSDGATVPRSELDLLPALPALLALPVLSPRATFRPGSAPPAVLGARAPGCGAGIEGRSDPRVRLA